jgi:DNA-binding IclR family transcriptional regulator
MTLHAWKDIRDIAGRASAAAGDRKFVTALARCLEVLRAFTPTEGLLGNGELVELTGLPKPTVSRLTYTLTKLGYLAYVERLESDIGPRLVNLARNVDVDLSGH